MPKVAKAYRDMLRDWPPPQVADGQGRAGLSGVGRTLREKAEAVQRGEGRPEPQDDTSPSLTGAGGAVAAGGLLAGLTGVAVLLAPVVVGLVALLALTGGGPVGLLKGARSKAYNFARWGGNVQPWLELRPDKVVRRVVRRKIGKTVGKTFSWPRILGI